MSSAAKTATAERTTSRRDRRPTERAQYISETHKDKENRQHQQVNKTQERQDKARQKANKVLEREAYQKHGRAALSDTAPQVSVSRSVHDPGFACQSVVTPMRDPNLVARKSVVPPAPRRISTGD
ncbi:hypothetical protein CY34DRAFT_19913, partial [Suillus luteus UH-Slu-Lm8-n1]